MKIHLLNMITLNAFGITFLGYDTTGSNTWIEGIWDFSAATIIGLTTTTEGSHSHDVVVAGTTYTTSSAGSHSHDVE